MYIYCENCDKYVVEVLIPNVSFIQVSDWSRQAFFETELEVRFF